MIIHNKVQEGASHTKSEFNQFYLHVNNNFTINIF